MSIVFQYGSNTLPSRINSEDRLHGDAQVLGKTKTAKSYDFVFDIWSNTNNCAAADIISGGSTQIWGVLYRIPDFLISRRTSGKQKSLDAIEGESSNYSRVTIEVELISGIETNDQVITYIGKNRKQNIKTNFEYSSLIIRGLHLNDIPVEYINYVKQQIIDNNPELEPSIENL